MAFDSDDALLAWLGEALIGADDPDAALQLLSAAVGRHLGASRSGYAEIDADGRGMAIPADWTDGVPSFAGRWPIRADDYHIRRYARGETTAYRDWRDLPLSDAERADMAASGSTAVVAVPLMREGRWESLFSVMDHRVRDWTEAEVALVRRVATLARSTLAHARAIRGLRASEEQFRTLAENIPGVCWLSGADGRSFWMNKAGVELLGEAAVAADNMEQIVHPDDLADVANAWQRARTDGLPIELTVRSRIRDGSYRPLLSRAHPIRDDTGVIVRWCGVQVDLTEERLRLRGDELLRTLSEELRELSDAEVILALTIRRLGEHLKVGRVAFAEPDADDPAIYHVRSDWTDGVSPSSLGQFRVGEDYPIMAAAYAAGRTMVSNDTHADPNFTPSMVAATDALGIRSGISVPLAHDGRALAVLIVRSAAPRIWTTDEIRLVEQVAERTWATLSRARAERVLRERDRHQAFLIAFNDAVRDVSEPRLILDTLSEMLRTHLGASRVLYSEIGADLFAFKVKRSHGDDPGSLIGIRHLPPQAYAPMIAAFQRGETVVQHDIDAIGGLLSPEVRDHLAEYGIRSGVNVPLVKDGRLAAVLTVHQDVPRVWQRDEIVLIEDVAERVWATVTRARAEQALREREATQATLLAWSDAVRTETTPRGVLGRTLATIGETLGVARVNFAEADARGDALVVADDWVRGVSSVTGQRFPLAALGATVVAEHLTGRTFSTEDSHADPRFDPATLALYDAVGARAFVSVPLVRGDRLIAVLSVQDTRPRTWSDQAIRLLCELADRTWAIIERARSEERLAESEALLAGFLENAPIAMYLKDTDGRYLRLNQQMANIVGVSIEYMVGKTSHELVDKAVADQIVELDRRALTDGVQASEISFNREQYQSLLSIRFPIAAPDGGVRLGGFTLDLTDRKRAEAELERSREALYQAEKLNALGSLLAGVSHELNNPLSIVVAQAVMMERQAGTSELADRARKIRKAADRCARIVQTFLAMARQKQPERKAVDLNAIAAAAIELADYGLRSDGIVVDCAFADGLPLISADADQLHQVIINLIVNAQHAMSGTSADARRLAVSTASGREPGTVTLDVIDGGPGIPEDLRRRIFEPFFTTKPQGEGTGVGLSFSLGLAEAHGGRLELLPSSNGAHFRLTLPITADVVLPAAAPAAASGGSEPAARRALIVDDEPDIAESLADFLGLEGFGCDVVGGGRAAMARLAEGSYDLIVSDLRMPDIDGPALYAWIGEHRPDLLPRVAFATGDTLGAAVARFIADVRRPVLEKPFMPDGVRRLIKQLEL